MQIEDMNSVEIPDAEPEVRYEVEVGAEAGVSEYIEGEEAVEEPVKSDADIALEQQMAAMQTQLQQAQQLADMAKVTEQLAKRPTEAPASTPAAPQAVDPAEFNKKINEGIIDDASGTLNMWAQQNILPAFQQMAAQQEALMGQISRMNAEKQDSNNVLQYYGEEVEEQAKLIGGNDRYQKAIQMVTAQHFDEILNRKMKEAEDKRAAEEAPPAAATAPAAYTRAGSQPAAKPGRKTQVKKLTLTAEEKRRLDASPYMPGTEAATKYIMRERAKRGGQR